MVEIMVKVLSQYSENNKNFSDKNHPIQAKTRTIMMFFGERTAM
jgi:hypothetical protein